MRTVASGTCLLDAMTEIIVKTKSGRKPPKTKVGRDDAEKISPKRQALGEKKRRDDSSDGRKAEVSSSQTPSANMIVNANVVMWEDLSPPPTIIWNSKSQTRRSSDADDGRRVQFSNVARIKLIPSDQLPPRPVHMERSVSNPKRRLWVLYRLCQVGGRYYPDTRNRKESFMIEPGTEWPEKWGEPPSLTNTSTKEQLSTEDDSFSDDSLVVK